MIWRALAVSFVLASAANAQTQQKARGNCSPAIAEVDGNVRVSCVVVSSTDQARDLALSNLDIVVRELRRLLSSQQRVFIPSLLEYIRRPSEARWRKVLRDIDLVTSYIRAATESVINYDSSLEQELDEELAVVLGLLDHRSIMLDELLLLRDDPPTAGSVSEWMEAYAGLLQRLRDSLSALRQKVELSS